MTKNNFQIFLASQSTNCFIFNRLAVSRLTAIAYVFVESKTGIINNPSVSIALPDSPQKYFFKIQNSTTQSSRIFEIQINFPFLNASLNQSASQTKCSSTEKPSDSNIEPRFQLVENFHQFAEPIVIERSVAESPLK